MPWPAARLFNQQKTLIEIHLSKLLLLASFVVLLGAFFSSSASAQTVPKLPSSWHPKTQQFTLIDFYSNYCSTCKMMEPYLLRLHVTNGKQLHIKHINAENRETWTHLFKYPITGTPTYFLFNAEGQPVYKMERVISPIILQTQVRRSLGALKQLAIPVEANLPKPLEGKENNWGNMILLVFEHQTGCQNCVTHQGQLHSMESVGKSSGLRVVYLDVGNLPSWAEAFRPKETPAYLLLDNANRKSSALTTENKANYGILLNVNGDIDMTTLWENIVLFGNNGITERFP
jgi:thiol-disulfide isomerase/thioredoxin